MARSTNHNWRGDYVDRRPQPPTLRGPNDWCDRKEALERALFQVVTYKTRKSWHHTRSHGRDDHLGGKLTPDLFKEHKNASHDDVLYAPHKTPEIRLPEARMYRDGKVEVLSRNSEPAEYMIGLLES